MIYLKPEIRAFAIEASSYIATSFTGDTEPIGSSDYLENPKNDNNTIGWD